MSAYSLRQKDEDIGLQAPELDLFDVVERPDAEHLGPVSEGRVHVANDVAVLTDVAKEAAHAGSADDFGRLASKTDIPAAGSSSVSVTSVRRAMVM